jgi:hypothetical protein
MNSFPQLWEIESLNIAVQFSKKHLKAESDAFLQPYFSDYFDDGGGHRFSRACPRRFVCI